MKTQLTPKQFYLLSFTWGILTTLPGCIVALLLMLFGKRPKKWGYDYYFELGSGHSGASMGIFFFTGKNPPVSLKNHELGHSLQNCRFGPLMPLLVNLPSTLRFWYRKLTKRCKTPYDSVWFEGQATRLGNELITKTTEVTV